MTRPIDRGHQASLDAMDRASIVAKAERALFVDELKARAATDAERLHDALGLPAGLRIVFDSRPVATDDATFEPSEPEKRA